MKFATDVSFVLTGKGRTAIRGKFICEVWKEGR